MDSILNAAYRALRAIIIIVTVIPLIFLITMHPDYDALIEDLFGL